MQNFGATPNVLMNNIFQHSNEAIAVFDEKMELRFKNSAANSLLNYFSIHDIISTLKTYLYSNSNEFEDMYTGSASKLRDSKDSNQNFFAPLANSKSGLTNYIEFSSSTFVDELNQTWISTIIRDVTARIKEELELRRLSLCDDLTSIYNRRGFYKELDSLHGQAVTIVIFDLDHFKMVNDSYGHAIGDKVLEHFAHAFLSKLVSANTIARLGGEEFIAAYNTNDYLIAIEEVKAQTRVINSCPNTMLPNYTFSAGVSYTTHLNSANDLLKEADDALYTAKSLGRNRIVLSASDRVHVNDCFN
jgi:diguanylate cyclase (GGDEF)-like protein